MPEPPTQIEIFESLPVGERKLWKVGFSNLDTAKTGKIPSDDPALREFLSKSSTLRGDDIDGALARFSEDGSLNYEAFEKLMQGSCQDDTVALTLFQRAEGETMDCSEARTQLLLLGQSMLNGGTDWNEQLWDKVLDAALRDVELELDMEAWVGRCAMFTRYVLALTQAEKFSAA